METQLYDNISPDDSEQNKLTSPHSVALLAEKTRNDLVGDSVVVILLQQIVYIFVIGRGYKNM